MEKFLITLPLTGEYLTTVRLTTGGLCALVGFNVDETEDFKVCVTESLLILKRNGYETASVTVYCSADNTHAKEINANITEAVTTPASCEATGVKTYTATVIIDDVSYTSTKEETLEIMKIRDAVLKADKMQGKSVLL